MRNTQARRNEVIIPVDEALTTANSALAKAETLLDRAYVNEGQGELKVKLCAMREETFSLLNVVQNLRNTLWKTHRHGK